MRILPENDCYNELSLHRVVRVTNRQRGYVRVEQVMRLRPKMKGLLPKIAEAIIFAEITPWNGNSNRKVGRPPPV
jgi:hypothetical protein